MEKKIRSLSGGEKSRLVMARMLLDPPNFLVLDEPTNHLDLATKEMLVEALQGFEGTMLFVSHDRTFLRGLSNRVLELPEEHDAPLDCTAAATSSTSSAPATKRRACTRSHFAQSNGRMSISTSPISAAKRSAHAMASSIDATSSIEKPAISSFDSVNGPSIRRRVPPV